MSSFHTKTISRILEPVAQQVSKLILHIEDEECTNQFIDLDVRVNMVKSAVENLVKVGQETTSHSNDEIFIKEMPKCLHNVTEASNELVKAVTLLQNDHYSKAGRNLLISGSRGILKGTYDVLNCFDMSEVRKIVSYCENVLIVLGTVENVFTMNDLKEVIKNLTPCMTLMISDVVNRLEELVIPYHVEILNRSVEEIKRLTPILISSLKLYITSQDNPNGNFEIKANRDFLITQMTDEIQEIIRALRLTSHDNEEMITFKAAKSILTSCIKSTRDSLLGNKKSDATFDTSFRQTISAMRKINQYTIDTKLRGHLDESIKEFEETYSKLTTERYKESPNQGHVSELSKTFLNCLVQLEELCQESIVQIDSQPGNMICLPRTFEGKFNQARQWILNPSGHYKGIGYEACKALTNDSRRLLSNSESNHKPQIVSDDQEWIDACIESCDHLDRATAKLDELAKKPQTVQTIKNQTDLSLAISKSLMSVWKCLRDGLVYEVADWFTDILGPLRQFTEVVSSSKDDPNVEGIDDEFYDKSDLFSNHCERICNIAEVAASNLNDYLKADALRTTAFYLPELTNQVLLSGKTLFMAGKFYPHGRKNDYKTIEKHFELMKQHWITNAEKMQSLVDESLDALSFISAQEKRILNDSHQTEYSLKSKSQLGIVESTTSIARRVNRILQIGKKEAENSEDVAFTDKVKSSLVTLHSSIKPMVMYAKQIICNFDDKTLENDWRRSNKSLIHAVSDVKNSVTYNNKAPTNGPTNQLDSYYQKNNIPVQEMQQMTLNDERHIPTNCLNEFSDLYYPPQGLNHYGTLLTPKDISSMSSALTSSIRTDLPETENIFINPFFNSYNNFSGCLSIDEMTQSNLTQTFMNGAESTRPSSPETEYEEEFNYPSPTENQPIMAAAYALNHEARLWSSKDNEIIVAVRKMAALMAKLSLIMRGEYGTKKELINISIDIAEASLEVQTCASSIAKECTDRRMRNNLEQLAERITMISNQLKIIATVKATMLGTVGSVEDQQNTEVLVGNAQNLMQTVIETVHAAEGASLRLRGNQSFKIRWHPRIKNYQHYLDPIKY